MTRFVCMYRKKIDARVLSRAITKADDPYLDPAADPVSGLAFGAEGPPLSVAFEELPVVRVKGDGIWIPSGLPVQRVSLRSQTDSDRAFRP